MSSVNPFDQSADIYNKKISSSKTNNTNQSSDVNKTDKIDTSGSIYSESSDSKHYSNGLSIENDSEIDSNTYNVIKEQLENEIEQKKQALQDKKDDRGWATSLWNGAKELFGGGDKAELKEIEKLEEELKTLETEPDNLDAVYKSIMGKDLSAEEISKIRNSSSLVSSLDSSTKQAIIDELENQYEQIEDSLETAKNSNGWISGAWDKFKNWTGIGASSNKSETQLENMKEEIEALKENPDNLAEAYKNITGKDLTTDELDKFISGETSLVSDSKAAESVSKYSEGQKMATDIVADVTSGIVAVGAIAAAPFTGGASLLLAAGVGAGVKVGLKASDCIGNEKTYGLSDLAYDSVTGSINGMFAPISNGLGGAAGTGVAKAFGLEAAENTVKTALKQTAKTVGKEAAEEVLEQGAKQAGKSTISKILAKQGTEYVLKEGAESTLKTTIGKVAAYGTDMVVDGALSGATDGFARALGEGRIEDIPQDTLNGLAGGAVASPLIGGGFRLATKGGSKIGNMIGKSDIGDSVADEVSDKSKSSFLNKAGELKDAASDKLHKAGDKIKNSNAYQKAGELKDAASDKLHQAGDKIKNSTAYQKAGELKDAAKDKFHQMAEEYNSTRELMAEDGVSFKDLAADKLHQTGDKIKNSTAYQKAGELKHAAKNKFHQMTKENKVSKDSIIPSPDETQIDGQLAFADAAPSSGSIKNVDETITQTGDNSQIPGQMTIDDINKAQQKETSTIPFETTAQISSDNPVDRIEWFNSLTHEEKLKNLEEEIYGSSEFEKCKEQIQQLDDKQLSKIFELSELEIYKLDDAIKYSKLDDISYTRFIDFKKNGGINIISSVLNDPYIILKQLGELDEKQAARLGELAEINIPLDMSVKAATLDDASYSRLVDFKKNGGYFSSYDLKELITLDKKQAARLGELLEKDIENYLGTAIKIAQLDDISYSRLIEFKKKGGRFSSNDLEKLVNLDAKQAARLGELAEMKVTDLKQAIQYAQLDDTAYTSGLKKLNQLQKESTLPIKLQIQTSQLGDDAYQRVLELNKKGAIFNDTHFDFRIKELLNLNEEQYLKALNLADSGIQNIDEIIDIAKVDDIAYSNLVEFKKKGGQISSYYLKNLVNLDEKQAARLGELAEIKVTALKQAIEYAQLDDVSYSRLIEYHKNGGKITPSLNREVLSDDELYSKVLKWAKQGINTEYSTKLNERQLGVLAEFKNNNGSFSIYDIEGFSQLTDEQYEKILNLSQNGITVLQDAVSITTETENPLQYQRAIEIYNRGIDSMSKGSMAADIAKKLDDKAYSRYIDLYNIGLDIDYNISEIAQFSDSQYQRVIQLINMGLDDAYNISKIAQFSDSQYQQALDLINKGVLPMYISEEMLDNTQQYQKALELSQFVIPGYNVSKGVKLEGIHYKKELEKLKAISSGLDKSSLFEKADDSLPFISEETKQKIVTQLNNADVSCSINNSIETLAYCWQKKYITGVNALDNELTELVMPYKMKRYTSEYAQPMARWMQLNSNVPTRYGSLLYEDFIKTFPDIGEIYEPQRMQSFAKTLYGAEIDGGNNFSDSNSVFNVKFVVYPKNKLTQAFDTGQGKYGADEVIYPPNQKFKVLYKINEPRKELEGKLIYTIYMQEI